VTAAQVAAACGATLRGDGSAVVTGLTHRSQEVQPGHVFAALPGQRRHGIEFLAEALARGATAVLSDREPGPEVPWLASAMPRRATALAAWALAGHPERRLRLVGVTGTNGKSTVVDLLGRIARAAGERVGVFGTLAYELPDRRERSPRTTPEATDLAPLLAELADGGGTLAVMEVSSHAIALDRVAGLPFDVAVWTNLTRDHLDFHGTMEAYFEVKRRLVGRLRADPPGRRVIGADDPTIATLLDEPRSGDLAFGLGEHCTITAREPRLSLEGTSFVLVTPAGEVRIDLPLVGQHNLRNALAAAGAATALSLPLTAITEGLAGARPVPGRLEPVALAGGPAVFVDFAHTPDALEKVLSALRAVSDRRLIVVFGCGGEKDPGKRAPMGEVVGRLADVPIVSSDNPRSEDPLAIIDAVMVGVRASGNTRSLAIADRREAIAAALAIADERSIIVLAGKGHETEQVFADRVVPFDDREVVRELARRRRG
jgi:UDP-N-acetylmuramoyl-L-alanyl-D-glutamate--2,6-diaminopimelate ligase